MTELPGTFPAGTTTYYAKWTAEEATIVFDYTAIHDPERVTYTGTTDMALADGTPALTELPKPEVNNFRFVRWFSNDGRRVSTPPAKYPAGETIYTAKWVVTGQGVITFVTNGGTDCSDLQGRIGNSVTSSLPTTSRAG